VAWSSYANVLALGTGGMRQDGADFVVLYDPTTGQILNERTAVGQGVDSLTWSRDGRTLAAGSAANETVVIFAPGSGPSPTPAPIEPTITPVPVGVTPIPSGPPAVVPATATAAMPLPPTPIGQPVGNGNGNVPDSLRAAVWNLRHIVMADANNGWGLSTVGEYPNLTTTLLRTTNGARTWSYATPHGAALSGAVLVGMRFLSGDAGWVAAGQANTRGIVVYRTTDGGKTWGESLVPTRHLFVHPYARVSLDFVDSRFGWMTVWGAGGMSSTPGQLFATQDGGATWAEVSSTDDGGLPFGGDIRLLDTQHRDTGWLVGSQASTAPKQLYITHDGGKTWTEQRLTLADAVEPSATISVLSVPTFFSGAASGKGVVTALVTSQKGANGATDQSTAVFITADGGNTWRGATAVPYSYPGSSFFLNAAHWWIWSTDPLSAKPGTATKGQLYRTTNGEAAWSSNGADWEKVCGSADWLEKGIIEGYQVSELGFTSPQSGWMLLVRSDSGSSGDVSGGSSALLLRTLDGGQNWGLADLAVPSTPAP
jgi:photosystem II stability/assembly factor-like uncharacterized protein